VRWVAAQVAIVLGALLVGCGDDGVAPDPLAEIRRAARATLAEPSMVIAARVTSRKSRYTVRGRIQAARDRYYARAGFARGGREAFPTPPFRIVGTGAQTYIGQADLPTFPDRPRCWFDPHLPIGSAPGTISVQESLALVAVVMRLLADGTEQARIAGDQEEAEDGGTRYDVWVDPSAATALRRHSDELFGSPPKRLTGALDLPVTAETIDGRLSRLSLELPRFESAAYLRRFRGRHASSIEVSLTRSERELELRPPQCIAME
jgi:hypothetical protein